MPDPLLLAGPLLATALSVLVAKAWRWARRAYFLSRIPGPKGDMLGGQMKHFSERSDHHKALRRWAAEFGGLYRIRLVDTTVRLGTGSTAEPCHRAAALTCTVQMIVVSDPLLVDVVLARGNEVEKSVEAIYSRLNIVRLQGQSTAPVPVVLSKRPEPRHSCDPVGPGCFCRSTTWKTCQPCFPASTPVRTGRPCAKACHQPSIKTTSGARCCPAALSPQAWLRPA